MVGNGRVWMWVQVFGKIDNNLIIKNIDCNECKNEVPFSAILNQYKSLWRTKGGQKFGA